MRLSSLGSATSTIAGMLTPPIEEGAIVFLEKFQSGEAVAAVMLGNSIGMGYNATGHEALHTKYNDSRGFAVEHRLDGSVGHSAMLRNYLKSKNPHSELVNLSGDGWDSNDQLGIAQPTSSAPAHESSELVIESLIPKPDVVFIPLQVNDANHLIPLSVFDSNTRRLVSFIQKAGIEPVIVKENDTRIKDYDLYQSHVSNIAKEMKVEVIDTYTPTRGRPDLLSDYAHVNDAGHKIIFDQYRNWLNKLRQ